MPCHCPEYWRTRNRPGTGRAFAYRDHSDDCPQHRFAGVYIELRRFQLVCRRVWVYATVPAEGYAAWAKRVSNPRSVDYDPRLRRAVVKVVSAPGDQHVVLAPFPPGGDPWEMEPDPMNAGDVTVLAMQAVSAWRYPARDRLVNTLGAVSWRDFQRGQVRVWESYGEYTASVSRR
jgi:hypothetical protein